MNTVNDLRQVLEGEMRRLQPPAGLENRVLQQALRSPVADPALGSRRRGAIRSREMRLVEMPRLMVLVAALLALAIVVSLFLAARALHSTSIVPVHPGPPPTAHPANGLIAISANPKDIGGGEVGDIYLVSEGAPARRIIGSDGDHIAQACPRFSPDGRWLAYGEARASDPVTTFRGVWPVTNRAVVVVGINGHGDASRPMMRVTLPSVLGEIPCPKWSPTGTQVAFRTGPQHWVAANGPVSLQGGSELWVTDASSGKTTVFPVADTPWGQNAFEWSRDGSLIAESEPGQIRVLRMGGGESVISLKGGATPGSLGWTAGDDRIVYISPEAPGDGLAIDVVGVDGNSNTQLTVDSTNLQIRFYQAVVSPGGTRVAYVQRTNRCTIDSCSPLPERLLIMGTDGSKVAELPIPTGFGVSGLQWSPDGQRLLFASIDGVVSVAVALGSPAVVYSRGELNLEWSASQLTWQPVFP